MPTELPNFRVIARGHDGDDNMSKRLNNAKEWGSNLRQNLEAFQRAKANMDK